MKRVKLNENSSKPNNNNEKGLYFIKTDAQSIYKNDIKQYVNIANNYSNEKCVLKVK